MVKLSLDIIFFKSDWSFSMVIFILTAIAFRGANGIPGSVPVRVSHIFKNDFKDSNKVSNKSTV